MPDRPWIGVTTRFLLFSSGAKMRPAEMVPRGYLMELERAGALAVLLPTLDSADAAEAHLDRLDGLLLSGGEDIHPRFYGEEPLAALDSVDERRDRFEMALVRGAHRRDLPVFGVCRGIQVMNVALGGDLFQDIPSQTGSRYGHTQKSSDDILWHRLQVAPESLLHRILGRTEVAVNSFHHQACRRIGEGLAVTAKTVADDIVEGLEDPGRRFFLGVQWHPEISAPAGDVASRSLFEAFVEAAGKRAGPASNLLQASRSGR